MSKKFLIFALGAFLLVHSTYGNAISLTTSAEAEDQKLDAAGFEFVRTIIIEVLSLVDKVFNSSINAFEPIFAEVSTTTTTKNVLQDKVIELKKFVASMAKSEDKDAEQNQPDKGDFINKMFDILNDFEKAEEQGASLTDFDKKVLKVGKALKADFKKYYVTHNENIVNAAEKLWKSKLSKQQEALQKFHDVFTQLKNEQDIDKKAEILNDLLEFHGSSEKSNRTIVG